MPVESTTGRAGISKCELMVSSFPHTVRVVKELALLRVMLVHPLEEIAKRLVALRHTAHLQIKKDADNLSFVVIRDAAFGRAVIRIFFQPGIEAGLFRRLRLVRRMRLQLPNLQRQPSKKGTFVNEAGADERVVGYGVVDAFAEPKRARIVFTGIVDGLK
jgi:hypothetical protein